MYDAVTPANLPSGGDLYAGYVDGHYANVAQIQARFPDAKVVTITVIGGNQVADVVDVETGDVTPEHAPAWVLRMRWLGRTPSVYCSTSAWPSVRAAFAAQGVAEPPYWVANYSHGYGTIPDGAVAHQDGGENGYDHSVVADYWVGIDSVPTSAPLAVPEPPKEYPEVLTRTPITIPSLDDQGNGYVDTGLDPAKVFNVIVNGMAYEASPATLPHTYDRVADEWEVYNYGGQARVKIMGGQPHGSVQLYVWSVT